MTITREKVADLRPGDVVELWRNQWPDGTTVRGPLYEAGGWLYVAEEAVLREDGRSALTPNYSLTVVSRAPRPLYVNSDRTEPVPGDVVRDADSDDTLTYVRDGESKKYGWWAPVQARRLMRTQMPTRLRLLVDGTTGMPPAVTS